jgi:hypothetical protein
MITIQRKITDKVQIDIANFFTKWNGQFTLEEVCKVLIKMNYRYDKNEVYETIKKNQSSLKSDKVVFVNDTDLIVDVLELCANNMAKTYIGQISHIIKMIKPLMDYRVIGNILYKECVKDNSLYKCIDEKGVGVYTLAERNFEKYVKTEVGKFSGLSDHTNNKSNNMGRGGKRRVFLKPLATDIGKMDAHYLKMKYDEDSWVVSNLKNKDDIILLNGSESPDHVRTFYSREYKVKHDDVRNRRLKNYPW